MKSAQDEVRDLMERLPESASFDDIQYSIYVRQKVGKGLEAGRRGQVISQAEAARRMARWLDK